MPVDLRSDTQLFEQLTSDRCSRRLARLDMAARQIPHVREPLSVRMSVTEQYGLTT